MAHKTGGDLMKLIKWIVEFLESDRLETVVKQTCDCITIHFWYLCVSICQPVLLGDHFSVLRNFVVWWKNHNLLSIKTI